MKDIIFTQTKEVINKLVITKELFYKIQDELHFEPKLDFENFYQSALGNEFYTHIRFDYIQEKDQSGYTRDYYTDEEYHWESKAGLKRIWGDVEAAIKEYFKHHKPEFISNEEEIKNEIIDVLDKEEVHYYK